MKVLEGSGIVFFEEGCNSVSLRRSRIRGECDDEQAVRGKVVLHEASKKNSRETLASRSFL